jgi:hypothetical protein
METAPSDKASNATIDKTRGTFAPVYTERERDYSEEHAKYSIIHRADGQVHILQTSQYLSIDHPPIK